MNCDEILWTGLGWYNEELRSSTPPYFGMDYIRTLKNFSQNAVHVKGIKHHNPENNHYLVTYFQVHGIPLSQIWNRSVHMATEHLPSCCLSTKQDQSSDLLQM